MKRIQEENPIWHAMIWVFMYILLVNVGDLISENIGIDNSATSVLLIVLSVALLIYIKKNDWFNYYGIRRPDKADFKKSLFYVPLIIMALIQYFKGINSELGFQGIGLGIVLMICVGWIEEILFRGFLYQGILKKSGLVRAVIISGITFGIGHIVNLMRGYSMADQAVQIVAAILIGIALALLIAVTKNIMPGVVFHILFNISGTITNNNLSMEIMMVIAIIVICALYSIYLRKSLTSQKTL